MSAAGSGGGMLVAFTPPPADARGRSRAGASLPDPAATAHPGTPTPSWNWIAHPFHRRWFSGTLSASALRTYATEHYHVVTNLASCARAAAELSTGPFAPALHRSARQREHEIELWLDFAAAVGWRDCVWFFGEDPLPETAACVGSWPKDAGPSCTDPEGRAARLLVTLYAIESIQASVIALQGDALVRLYRLRDPRATAFFHARARRSQPDCTLAWAALSRLARTDAPHRTGAMPGGSGSWLTACLQLRWSAYRALLNAVHELTLDAPGVRS